ncbi:MAG TPA: Ger(x)C family spore germination protein [Clostridiaceae bacterium]
MKHKKLLILIFMSLLLTGCWDKLEIDQRSFISTIGIDPGKEIDKLKDLKKIKPGDPFEERAIDELSVTFGFPDISQLGQQKGNSAEDKYITTQAYSIEDGITKSTAMSSKSIFIADCQLLLLSSDILQYPQVVKQILDYFQRQPRVNKNMYILAVDGNTEDYIKFKPYMEKNIQDYISGVMENSERTATVLPVTLNELLILLNENGNAIIPRLTLDKDRNEIKLNGIAIIKKFALVGYLTPIETSDLEIVRGKVKSGKKVIYLEGNPVDFVIEGTKRKMNIVEKDQNFIVNIDLKLEGEIRAISLEKNLGQISKLKEVDDAFNNALSIECTKIATMMQKNFGVDAIEIRENIEKYHPAFWKKISKDWEEVYKNSVINVNVDVKARRIGVTQ